MMQEAGNDNSFEIIDKKNVPSTIDNVAPTVSAIPMYNPSNIGNLLSSVPPPSDLPNFIAAAPIQQPLPVVPIPSSTVSSAPPLTHDIVSNVSSSPITPPQPGGNFYPTSFSAAIPPNKGATLGAIPPPNTEVPLNFDSIDDNQGGLFGWMKGAVSTGGIFSKVAEKAKNSVDSMITTLDPQMREFIYSGGDLEVVVASDREDVISPIREAFQLVFGRATVVGRPALVTNVAAQTVGFKEAINAANTRIASLHTQPETLSVPTVAVESFIFQMDEDKWFDMDVIVLNDMSKQIVLETFTQPTAVPSTIVTLAQSETTEQYPFKSSGLAVKVATLLSNNLQVPSYEWHEHVTGLSRRTLLLNAAKALAGLYKNLNLQKS
ncbi:protein PRRC1-like [Chrysoperla carnea]|uniref:protein PRRC1-like n=1 Tax=Chrysoperla carnea TaxID=189513 RepID=UPI001D08B0C2|nr:protein PRRC1-like [Chrysoperla carnea]